MDQKYTKNYNNSKSEFSKNSPCGNITMIHSLMKELSLRCKLQDEILQIAEKGQSLPYVPRELITSANTEEIAKINLKLPSRPLKRKITNILASGSYEREQYRPNPSKTRPATEKERLQNMMAFGKDLDKKVLKCPSKRKHEALRTNSCVLFDEILKEIKEREDFLKEMDELGLKKKYLPQMECQISLRLQELEKLDKDRAEEANQEYGR